MSSICHFTVSALRMACGVCLCVLCMAWAQELRPGSGWLVPGGSRPLGAPVRVLLTGDSLMESLGPQMRDALSGYSNLTLIPIGKKSTGLSRSDFYNWPAVLKQHLVADKPHVVIMWVGTNDPQGIYGMTGLGEPCSKAWQLAYLGKIREIFKLVRLHKARFILMGPPVVGDPKLNAQLADINRLMAWACKREGICYIDTRAILGDSHGGFHLQGKLPNGQMALLRTADRVHITADGNKRVMHYLLPYVAQEIRRYFSPQSAANSSPAPQGQRRGSTGISGGSGGSSGKPAGRPLHTIQR